MFVKVSEVKVIFRRSWNLLAMSLTSDVLPRVWAAVHKMHEKFKKQTKSTDKHRDIQWIHMMEIQNQTIANISLRLRRIPIPDDSWELTIDPQHGKK